MAGENRRFVYDYGNHPGIGDFKANLNRKDSTVLHPWLKKRADEAVLLSGKANIEVTKPVDHVPVPTSLIPHAADQGLLLTPYDKFDGMEVAIPEPELIEGWRSLWEENLRIANEPSRIEAMRILEQEGFTPPPYLGRSILDESAERGIVLQLSDLGQNIDLTSPPSKDQIVFDTKERQKQFVEEQMEIAQTHRTDLLATGPLSFVGKRVRSFFGLGAMPDVNGSVLALTTAAKLHMLAEIPEVGYFSSIENQAALAKAVLEELNTEDPLLEGRSEEDKAYIVAKWRANVCGALEVSPEKALRRFVALREVGVEVFRPYGHTVGGDIIKAIRALKREDEKAEVLGSQITNEYTALACEYEGSDGLIEGVGSGGRCTTADLSQLIPSNALLSWRLRGKLSIPLIGEGGAIDEPVIAALVGMSGVNGSGSIAGGTFEAPGGMYFLKDRDGNYFKPYGGEASPRTKWLSGRTYSTGYPYFSEGDQGFKQLKPLQESMTVNVLRNWERFILGSVTLNVDAGPFVVREIQGISPSPLFEKSSTTQYLQKPH